MDRPLASVVSAFSCVPRVSAVSAANSKDAVYKAWQYEYRDRKRRKGQFRRLWIARISAAVRDRGLTYSRFMEGLKAANIDLDRKVLADLAVSDEKAFDVIFAQAKKAIEAKDGAALRA